MDFKSFSELKLQNVSKFGLTAQLETVMSLYGITQDQVMNLVKKYNGAAFLNKGNNWKKYIYALDPMAYLLPFIWCAYELAGQTSKIELIVGDKASGKAPSQAQAPGNVLLAEIETFRKNHFDRVQKSPKITVRAQMETVMSLVGIDRNIVLDKIRDAGFVVKGWERTIFHALVTMYDLLYFTGIVYQIAGINLNKVVIFNGSIPPNPTSALLSGAPPSPSAATPAPPPAATPAPPPAATPAPPPAATPAPPPAATPAPPPAATPAGAEVIYVGIPDNGPSMNYVGSGKKKRY